MVRASKREANDRYDSKTYKLITIKLRVDDDADILDDFVRAKKTYGLRNREWIRDLFEGTKHK